MMKQISLVEARNQKLISYLDNYSEMLLIFETGFVGLRSIQGYEGGDTDLEEYTVNLLDISHSKVIACGVATQEELAALYALKEQKRRENIEQREREEYERLKKKFKREVK